MTIEDLRLYCLSKKCTTEEMPFDEDTLVFKVAGKMFALTSLQGDFSMNIKCDPEKAVELRETYSTVQPGYHMSKKHWNTVVIDGSVSDALLKKWIDDSYDLVVTQMPQKVQKEILESPE